MEIKHKLCQYSIDLDDVYTVDGLDHAVVKKFKEWRNSEYGTWCYENANQLVLHRFFDAAPQRLVCVITGYLSDKKSTFRTLKFSS